MIKKAREIICRLYAIIPVKKWIIKNKSLYSLIAHKASKNTNIKMLALSCK